MKGSMVEVEEAARGYVNAVALQEVAGAAPRRALHSTSAVISP